MRPAFEWLAGPRLPAQLALLAVALSLPALGVGYLLDDHFQRLTLREGHAAGAFATLSDPAGNRELIEAGFLPWWTAPELRLAFLRPLSVLTMRLDHWLWPDSPALKHAHSLLWLAGLVAAAAAFYRRVLDPRWVAGLAGLLFAVDEAHVIPAAWLANRNALLAGCFGALCLAAHDRARREGARRAALLSPTFLALALLSGEMGLGALAYLAAHALTLDRAPWPARLRALAPALGVAAAWAAAYRGLGCGTHGSGMYLDPLRDTAGFLAALPERAALLLLGQWTPLPARIGAPGDAIARPALGVALAVTALVVFAAVPLVRRSRSARFCALGMALSIVPVASTQPDNRLLIFVGLGAMGLLAEFLAALVPAGAGLYRARAPRVAARALAVFWVLAHLALAPLVTPVATVLLARVARRLDAARESVPGGPGLAGRTLVVVNAPDYLATVTDLLIVGRLEGSAVPARARALSAGPEPVEIARLDQRTMRVRVPGGLYRGFLGRLFRDPRRPLAPGARVELSDLSVEIAASTGDGRPAEMIFRFAVPPEDPSLVWVAWQDGRYVPFTPPAIGDTVTVKAPEDPFGLQRRAGRRGRSE